MSYSVYLLTSKFEIKNNVLILSQCQLEFPPKGKVLALLVEELLVRQGASAKLSYADKFLIKYYSENSDSQTSLEVRVPKPERRKSKNYSAKILLSRAQNGNAKKQQHQKDQSNYLHFIPLKNYICFIALATVYISTIFRINQSYWLITQIYGS